METFRVNRSYVTQILGSVSERRENIVGTGENAGYLHFLLFLQCFQKPGVTEWLKTLVNEKFLETIFYPSNDKH